ncbi:cysteine-rich receptor-like protein kinase 8 [Tanacetum coccineum]
MCLLVYVDYILLTGKNNTLINTIKQQLSIKDLGHLNYYLGIGFLKNSSGLVMTQRKHALELINSASLLNVKLSSTPMDPLVKMNHNDGDLIEDFTLYRALVGKLLYLTITRPNIAFAAQTLSQFSQAPRTPHLKALIKVLRYLKSCPRHGFSFLTTQLCIFMLSVIMTGCLLKDLGISISSSISIYCDNASAIALASNPIQHARTKHIEIDCHFVRDKIRDGYVLTKFI